jgi:hypothetical protein
MNPRPAPRLWPAVLLLALVVSVEAALAAGGFAYTKNLETKLLAEPRPLAPVTGKVRYASKLTVQETKGPWLHVSDATAAGWVFAGNLSETKPGEVAGTDGLGLSASKTTATAAARPLSPVAEEYATQHKLVNARNDLDWLLKESSTVTAQNVDDFLQKQKKGEFQ